MDDGCSCRFDLVRFGGFVFCASNWKGTIPNEFHSIWFESKDSKIACASCDPIDHRTVGLMNKVHLNDLGPNDVALFEEHSQYSVSSKDEANWFLFRDEKDYLVATHIDLPKFKPLVVDFLSSEFIAKAKSLKSRKQPFLRAIGCAPGEMVFDFTAGLGADSFLLVSQGLTVKAFEKDPLTYCLLKDGVRRYLEVEDSKEFDVVYGDACFQEFNSPPSVVFLDPMFPEKKKGRLSKGSMQYLQQLSGEPTEGETIEMLRVARGCATSRVVVKRPIKAAPLADDITHSYEGSSIRYDVYSCKS